MSPHPTFDAAGALVVRDWDEMPQAIAVAEQAGAIRLGHLLRANLQGRIAFLSIAPSTSARTFKQFAAQTRNKPSIVLVGDDDYAPNAGPRRWPLASRIMRWAAGAMVHAAGAEIPHYDSVITAAEISGRIAIAECSTTNAEAWVELARVAAPNKPSLALIWPSGGPHPIAPKREALQ